MGRGDPGVVGNGGQACAGRPEGKRTWAQRRGVQAAAQGPRPDALVSEVLGTEFRGLIPGFT